MLLNGFIKGIDVLREKEEEEGERERERDQLREWPVSRSLNDGMIKVHHIPPKHIDNAH